MGPYWWWWWWWRHSHSHCRHCHCHCHRVCLMSTLKCSQLKQQQQALKRCSHARNRNSSRLTTRPLRFPFQVTNLRWVGGQVPHEEAAAAAAAAANRRLSLCLPPPVRVWPRQFAGGKNVKKTAQVAQLKTDQQQHNNESVKWGGGGSERKKLKERKMDR